MRRVVAGPVRRRFLRRRIRHDTPPGLGLVAVVMAAVLVACTGGRPAVDPPHSTNAVVASADRLRSGQTRLGGPDACLHDAFCAPGLSRVYGIDLGHGGVALGTPGATLGALTAGAIDIGALAATSSEIADARIAVLTDDRQLAPADNVVPVVSDAVVRRYGPPLAAAVDQVSAALGPAALAMLDQALAGGASPALAAQAWEQAEALPVAPATTATAGSLTIGYRSDDESHAVAEVYARSLARAGWSTAVKAVGGGRADELDALGLGQVDLVPDQAAGLLEHLAGFSALANGDVAHTLILLRYRLADLGLIAFAPAPARRETVFAITKVVASALGLSTGLPAGVPAAPSETSPVGPPAGVPPVGPKRAVPTLSDLARATGARLPPLVNPLTPTPAEIAADTEGPLAVVSSTVGIGATGPAVVALQQRLAQLGYDRSGAAGSFDEATRRAVAAFQADHGLIPVGAQTPATARALADARPVDRPGTVPVPGDPNSVKPPSTINGSGTPGAVYLVFSGGPSPLTPKILDVLARASAKATFSAELVGVGDNPETLRQIAAAGDAVAVTTEAHDAAAAAGADVMFRSVVSTQDAVATALARTPTCLVAPYGATGAAARQQAADRGLKVVLADVDPQDWLHPGADAIAGDVIASVHPGSIVLLHDGGGDRAQTVSATETIVSTLGALGYRFGTLPGC